MNFQNSEYFTNLKKYPAKVVGGLVILCSAFTLIGCSFDENVVKECGQEHPNSLWGQILCQNKKEKEIAELRKKIQQAKETEARIECLKNFTKIDFPAKAKQIYEVTKNDFDKDIKFISKKLTGEIGLVVGKEYERKGDDAQKWKSLDFVYQSKCDVKHIQGVTTITFDESGTLVSMSNHSEWINVDNEKVKKELQDFSHPKLGNPSINKRFLGRNFALISELEKRLGPYDRSEGCFYFMSLDRFNRKEQIQIAKGWTEPDIWPKDSKYCLVIDKVVSRKIANDEEVNIILTGNGEGAGRFYPGVVSAHSFLIQSTKIQEQYHSIHPIGSFQYAPTNWEPALFSNAGPTGWIKKRQYCAQGCWDIVTFLVPVNGKYWETEFNASSWEGQADIDKTNFKIKYEIVHAKTDNQIYALSLEINGMDNGLPYKKNVVVNFDLKQKIFPIPKNFIPPV
jgi:hypothetical protein